MKQINTWQWVAIPYVNVDKNKIRHTVFVLLLIKETPYNTDLFAVYGTGLRVERIRTIEFS